MVYYKTMDKWVMCVVALLLGMLLANMLKNVCGCKNIVEGYSFHPPTIFHDETILHPGDLSFFFAKNRKEINENVHNFIKNNKRDLLIKNKKLLESDGEFANFIKSLKFPLNNKDYMKIVNYKPIDSTYEVLMDLQDKFSNYYSNSIIEGCFGICIAGGIILTTFLLGMDAVTALPDPCILGGVRQEDRAECVDPPPPTPGSCAGLCGAELGNDGTCYCDAKCMEHGDCCDNYDTDCPGWSYFQPGFSELTAAEIKKLHEMNEQKD